MFEELFTRPAAIEQYHTAPLADDRLRYLVHCAECGARRETLSKIAIDQLCLVRLLDLQVDETVSRPQLEAASKAPSRPGWRLHPRPASLHIRKRFIGHTTRWMCFLGRLEETEKERHPHADEVDAYEVWMRRERGLSEETIRGCCVVVDQFFVWLADSRIPLASVSITDIDKIIAAWNARKDYSRNTIKVHAERLRSFFRFAEERGWCTPGMAAAIRPPRVYTDEPVPAGLRREDVLRLLATTESDRPVDKRDRAILMLLVAYGLRASEVTGLQLDDLDWENDDASRPASQAGPNTSLSPVPRRRAGHSSLHPRGSAFATGTHSFLHAQSPIPAGKSRGIEEHCCTALGPPRSHDLAPRAARTAACGCPASSRSGHVIQGDRGLSRAPRPVVHRRLRQGQPQCTPGSRGL